ncbi:hypothetical protein, partial [Aeromonas caviae]
GLFCFAPNEIAQTGLSSLPPVIYYSKQLFSREVALWSEPGQGSETLILDDGAAGIVIELEMKDEKMWTMDGRYKSKPVLRKLFHTSISFDNSSQSVSMLKQTLIKELRRGGTL